MTGVSERILSIWQVYWRAALIPCGYYCRLHTLAAKAFHYRSHAFLHEGSVAQWTEEYKNFQLIWMECPAVHHSKARQFVTEAMKNVMMAGPVQLLRVNPALHNALLANRKVAGKPSPAAIGMNTTMEYFYLLSGRASRLVPFYCVCVIYHTKLFKVT